MTVMESTKLANTNKSSKEIIADIEREETEVTNQGTSSFGTAWISQTKDWTISGI